MLTLKNRNNNDDILDTNDQLVVINDDTNTADIVSVTSADAESVISAGKYKVPTSDCKIFTGTIGRIFIYNAPGESIKTTENLAKLEYSTVLSQITAYRQPKNPTGLDWIKIILFVLLFIAMILIAL